MQQVLCDTLSQTLELKATALDVRAFMGKMKLFPEDFREGTGG